MAQIFYFSVDFVIKTLVRFNIDAKVMSFVYSKVKSCIQSEFSPNVICHTGIYKDVKWHAFTHAYIYMYLHTLYMCV